MKMKLLGLLVLISMVIVTIGSVEPLVWYEYENISGELYYGQSDHYGPREPYAVKVKMKKVEPAGTKVRVAIIVNGVKKWRGYLGSGESSPTITCNDQETVIDVYNTLYGYVKYKGRITWIMH